MFDEILKLRRPRSLSQEIVDVVSETVDIAYNSNNSDIGLRLAAAFDLLASVEYYNSVTNRGWSYCSSEPQYLLYPYTNTCPRCLGNHKFVYTKANKPESAQIGLVTTELLCTILELVFKKRGLNIDVYKASEPIDAIVYDHDQQKLIIAEVKSSPMMTIPLAIKCEKLTENIEGEIVFAEHTTVDNPLMKQAKVGMFFTKTDTIEEKFIPLNVDWSKEKPFYYALRKLYTNDPEFFNQYYEYWKIAYKAYSDKNRDCSLFWLTNGCGQPVPRPNNWPSRSGTGYESISDAKTSVGMDRTDDIKKAIYQVLKLGSEYKPTNDNIKTAIISNIHAVRHYDDYLYTVRDIIWAQDHTRSVTIASQLDPSTPIYNLFDGILAFTRSDIRDEWIKEIFNFEKSSNSGGENGI